MDLDPSTFESMTPTEFAGIVTAMSDQEVAQVMRGQVRGDLGQAAKLTSSFDLAKD